MRTPFLPAAGPSGGRVYRAAMVHRPDPLPFESWPEPLRYYAKRKAAPGDRGLGDVLERSFGTFGRLFKRFWTTVVGRDCGCVDRKRWLNERYPLPENH